MKKRTLQLTLATVLFGAWAITASAEPNVWIQTSGMSSNLSSEVSTDVSSEGSSKQSKQVQSQTYRDGDEFVKKTIEVTIKNGVKTTKITEERTKDGHTNATTQIKTENLKGSKCWKGCQCFGLKNPKKYHGDCKEKSRRSKDDQGNIVVDQNGSVLEENDDATEAAVREEDEGEEAAREEAAREEAARERTRQIMQQRQYFAQYLAQKVAQYQKNMRKNILKNMRNKAQRMEKCMHNRMAALDQEIKKAFGVL